MTALSSTALPALSAPTPTYDRRAATVGIVHFGFGNFHRSHEAMYLDRLMESGAGLDWGICGVGVLDQDAAMRDAMRAQDCLFTLVVRHPDGTLEPRVVGSVLEYLFAPEDSAAVYDRLSDPAVRIVTLTVTEGGYLRNAATGDFDPSHPSVAHDRANVEQPSTAFAFIVEGLRRRRDAGMAPFTVLSCDNLQGNGEAGRETVVSYARLLDPGLAGWIEAEVAFPNCMVDRITPSTTDADRDVLRARFGLEDRWPVPAEPFTQWIVEDHFPLGRPALHEVGVQFVDDVGPYELMKLRLLNASHQALSYLGGISGYVFVDESTRDDRIRMFLERYMSDEAAPTLGELPGIDLEAYMASVIERFGNSAVRDTLVRVATDGSNRMATFTLPAIRANLSAGRPVVLGAAMCAAWAEYWRLIAEGRIAGDQVPADAHAESLVSTSTDRSPRAFIEQTDLFGDLAEHPLFSRQFLRLREMLRADGVPAFLDSLLT